MAVPNTNTFSFWDVCDAIYGNHTAPKNLDSAFTDSNAAYFDPVYGSKTMDPKTLYGFRNYGGSVSNVSVTTDSVSGIGYNYIDAYGTTAILFGSPSITERGFAFGSTINPTRDANSYTIVPGTVGSYTYHISINLPPNNWFYIRAYIISDGVTSYGSNIHFLTGPTMYSQSNGRGETCPLTLPFTYDFPLSWGGAGGFGVNYQGQPWKTLVITAFNPNSDGNSESDFKLMNGLTQITAFPFTLDITGYTVGQATGIGIRYYDTTGNLCSLPLQSESCIVTYYVIDVDDRMGYPNQQISLTMYTYNGPA